MEKYVKEFAFLLVDAIQATGKMFKEEHLRMINMVSTIHTEGLGGGCNRFTAEGIMEHKVIKNFRMVNGDKFLFRQWHQRFVTALSQSGDVHEEIVLNLVREIDLGNELYKITENPKDHYGEVYKKVAGDVWDIQMDKA